jgi:MYXO-CTERM domain-containing protein
MRLTIIIAAFAITLLSSPLVLADAVPPPPMDCGDGSTGETCHGGPHCRPSTCTSNADCTVVGQTCQDVPMCIGTVDCAGMGGSFPVDTYEGPCNNNAPCVVGSCETRKVCAAGNTGSGSTGSGSGAGDPSTGPSSGNGSSGSGGGSSGGKTTVDQGCGCALIGEDASQHGWLLLVAALMLLARRRD